MKIRTDFVTNSSSSSFSILLTVETKSGDKITYSEDPSEYNVDFGGNVSFDGELSEVIDQRTNKLKQKYSDVESLARYLMNSIWDDLYDEDFDEDFCDEDDEFYGFEKVTAADIEKRKEKFVANLAECASTTDEIAKITVVRAYCASGEFADLVADNDEKLCALAKAVVESTGEKRAEVLLEMREYIGTSNPGRRGETFGYNYEDFRYNWSGDDNELVRLAERLCSGYGPDMTEGAENQELDLSTGKVTKYAEFELC